MAVSNTSSAWLASATRLWNDFKTNGELSYKHNTPSRITQCTTMSVCCCPCFGWSFVRSCASAKVQPTLVETTAALN